VKVTYDPQVDVLNIVFADGPIDQSGEESPGIIIDYDRHGRMVAIEILQASKRLPIPQSVDYSVAS